MRLRSFLRRLAHAPERPAVEVVETAGGGPVLVGNESPERLEARRLLMSDDVAADFAIGIVPDAHPRVLAELARLHAEAEAAA